MTPQEKYAEIWNALKKIEDAAELAASVQLREIIQTHCVRCYGLLDGLADDLCDKIKLAKRRAA